MTHVVVVTQEPDGELDCELKAEIDAIVREAYYRANKDYLREQSIQALVASGKNREEAEEWLKQCEIRVNG